MKIKFAGHEIETDDCEFGTESFANEVKETIKWCVFCKCLEGTLYEDCEDQEEAEKRLFEMLGSIHYPGHSLIKVMPSGVIVGDT